MAFPFAAAGGLLSSGLGVMAGRKANKDAQKAQQVAMNMANQSFTPIDVTGPGGAGVTFGGRTGGDGTQGQPIPGTPYFSDGFGGKQDKDGLEVVAGTRGRVRRSDIGSASLSAGDLEGLRAGLANQATGIQGASGLDANTLGLLANLQGAAGQFGDAGLQGLGNLQQLANTGVGLSATGLADASDFAGQLRGQAQTAFGALPGTQQQSTADTLALLRQQAAPQEERDFSRLQDNLFATGRSGTSGGGLMMESFAKGLGQADLSRQLAASGEGRAAQQAQLGLGSGLASQQDALLGNAMNRFQGMSGLSQNLGRDRFSRTSDIANQNFQRAGALLTSAPQFLQQQFEGGQLGNVGSALSNIGGINQNTLNLANLAQSLMGQQAAHRTGVAVPGTTADMSTANLLGQLGGAFNEQAGSGGVIGALGGLFGGGSGGNSPAPLNQFGFRGNPAG